MTNLEFIYEAIFHKCSMLDIEMGDNFIDEVFQHGDVKKYSVEELEQKVSQEFIQSALTAVELWYKAKKKELNKTSLSALEAHMKENGAYTYEVTNTYPLTKNVTIFVILERTPTGDEIRPYKLIQVKNKLFNINGERVN